MSVHFRPENKLDHHEENERVLDRLRCNDPALKELTLSGSCTLVAHSYSQSILRMFLPAFDAIATNTSLEILNIEGAIVMYLIRDAASNDRRSSDRVERALSLNTSLKVIRITTHGWLKGVLDIVMASPNLEDLTIRYTSLDESKFDMPHPMVDLTAAAQVLRQDTKLHSLTIEEFDMDSGQGAAFAAAFHGNRGIKMLIMRRHAISRTGILSFVQALPHDLNLETIVLDGGGFDGFDEGGFDEGGGFDDNRFFVFDRDGFDDFDRDGFIDDSTVNIVRALCHTPLKVLSLMGGRGVNNMRQNCCTRIVQTLKENEHSFTKLELFHGSQDSQWQNKIRLEIDLLTWENFLQVEKDTWVDHFLEQDTHTQELLFCAALERANKVDKERFSNAAPNMLFYLIKELPDLFVQVVREGH